MLCSVCNTQLKPVDYCDTLPTSTSPLAVMPDLTTVSLLCSSCYGQIRQALLMQKDKNDHDIAIIEKQIARRKRMRATSETLKADTPPVDMQSEIADEEQKIRELEEQLKLQSATEQIPTPKHLEDCHRARVPHQGSIRSLFVFNEAASAVNGFSLLQLDSSHAEKVGNTLQVADASSVTLPALRNRDSINAALAELALCVQMLHQATFGDIYSSVFPRQSVTQEEEGARDTMIYSVLVAALPAPLLVVYHDGAPTSVLQAISQQSLNPKLRKLRRAGRTVCELIWERPTANAKLFTSIDRDAFILGLNALLGFIVDLYIFLGVESPCTIMISQNFLNMYCNRHAIVEYYGHDITIDKDEAASQRRPLLLNPLYLSSAMFDEQEIRKLNIILVSDGARRIANVDGVMPVHPAAGPEQWNSFVCKLVVLCRRVYGHVMALLRQ